MVLLQPTDARRAFPCWDEPALKATFDVTLVAPKDRVALSNMVCPKQMHHFVLVLCPLSAALQCILKAFN